MNKLDILLPCAVFFKSGRPLAGAGVLILQLSLVFWPYAARLARNVKEVSAIDRLLTEFSDVYRVDELQLNIRPRKRFRRADLSEVFWGPVTPFEQPVKGFGPTA